MGFVLYGINMEWVGRRGKEERRELGKKDGRREREGGGKTGA